MNFGEIVSASRWQILENIAFEPASPVQLAEKLGTSVAYVSQQLKLLEAANIVTKSKTGLAEKGKPRNVYSIVQDVVTFSALMSGTPMQASIYPTVHQKIILRIWLYRDANLRQPLEKLYRYLEDLLSEIEAIYLDNVGKVWIVSSKATVNSTIKDFLKENRNSIKCEVVKSFSKDPSYYFLLDSSQGKVSK